MNSREEKVPLVIMPVVYRFAHDKERNWVDILEISKRNAAAWCSSNAEFKDYSIQDIGLNWTPFIG